LKRLDSGASGQLESFNGNPSTLNELPESWRHIVSVLTEARTLRPVQRLALIEARILESRQHLVVSAPTNSGKTLLGYLVLLDALLRGQRALLLEPLRVLAQEKADELTKIIHQLSPGVFASAPSVMLTTGDYRLDAEQPGAPPPEHGELVVATPERFDAILRNPANASWVSHLGAVVVDEAHLLGNIRRGPTLELLIASMLSLNAPPRLALLSATVGNPERLKEWLKPCQLLQSSARTELKKEVWALNDTESPDQILEEALRDVLAEPDAAALVFVYRRNSADALATRLTGNLDRPVLAYHSGQSSTERARRKAAFLSGQCRCVVSTTALAMGVNLPATHVFVRDTTFFGSGRLLVDELLQIVGRAGRGERAGTGIVLVRPQDDWDCIELSKALAAEEIQPIRSSFDRKSSNRKDGQEKATTQVLDAAATAVASCLSRAEPQGMSAASLRVFLGNTLAGNTLADRVDEALRWLGSTEHHLAYADDQGTYHLTVLGKAGVRAMLPLPLTAGLGQLVRDLLSLDPGGGLIDRWASLDHLLIIGLLSDRSPKLRRFSDSLADQIDAWHESRSHQEKSLLFAEWIAGSASTSKAGELLGSLGFQHATQGGKKTEAARSKCYVAMLSAIVLYERANGVAIADLEARWSISGLDGIEEVWRDTALWLLSGLAAMFEIRTFYHHLCENCGASADGVNSIKRKVLRIRHQSYDLMERIKHCSPLGGLLRGVRNLHAKFDGPAAGIGTIRKLEDAGITSIQQVSQLSVEELVKIGIRRNYATQVRRYLARRMK
jgi:helicase